MYSQPRLLQGVFPFVGQGLMTPFPIETLSYLVPTGKRVQPVYLRAGNSTDSLIYVVLMRNGVPMRYFPIGAKADSHVALAVVEDLLSETRLDAYLAAPENVQGTIVIDIGLVELNG